MGCVDRRWMELIQKMVCVFGAETLLMFMEN
jgi:hypothetical protein